MKINRIDAVVRRVENKHKPYLDNNIMKLMADYKFGGLYTKDCIQLNQMPETATKALDKLKIVFERLNNGSM
jgi:hypothetical protein